LPARSLGELAGEGVIGGATADHLRHGLPGTQPA
jgi:hypothetical protein